MKRLELDLQISPTSVDPDSAGSKLDLSTQHALQSSQLRSPFVKTVTVLIPRLSTIQSAYTFVPVSGMNSQWLSSSQQGSSIQDPVQTTFVTVTINTAE